MSATEFLQRNSKVLIAIVAFIAVMGVFYNDYFIFLLRFWDNEDYSYCYLVPVLTGYFLYRNRDRLFSPLEGGTVFIGYAFALLALFASLMGKAGSMSTFVFISMWFAVGAGLFFLFKDQRWKALLMPLGVLLFAIPAPPFLTNQFSLQLRLISSRLSIESLHALNVPAYRDGNLIDMGVQTLEVADACSGLRYFFPTILIAIVLGALYHRRISERLFLFIVSPIVAILANTFRITATGVLVKYVSVDYAVGFYHDLAGFVVYGMSIIFLLMLSVAIKKLFPSEPPSSPGPLADPRLNRRAPLHFGIAAAAMLALMPLQHSYSTEFMIPERQKFTEFPLQIGEWRGERRYLDEQTLRALGSDDYMLGAYVNPKTGNSLQLLVPYYQQQTIAHAAHAPASCLIGSGWIVVQKSELPPMDPRAFPVHRMVMNKEESQLISNFWFQQRGRLLTDEYLNKLYLFWDAVTRRRTDGALVRVEMSLTPGQDVAQGQLVLDEFLVNLKPLLEGHIPGWEADASNITPKGATAAAEAPIPFLPVQGSASVTGDVTLDPPAKGNDG